MATLGEMKASGVGVRLSCNASIGLYCSHSSTPSIDQLIQYFGVDFDIIERRAEFLARFVCLGCGRQFAEMRHEHPRDMPGLNTGIGGHAHQEPYTVAEATRRHHEFEAERKRKGFKTNAEIAAESRAAAKAITLALDGRGDGFIGPPDPRGLWRRMPLGPTDGSP